MDLGKILKLLAKRWYAILFVPLIAGMICYQYIAHQPMRYLAGAGITSSKQLSDVHETALSIVQENAHDGVKLSRWSYAKSHSTVFYASGTSPDECIAIANASVDELQSRISSTYPDIQITNSYHAKSATERPIQDKLWLYTLTVAAVSFGLVAALAIMIGMRNSRAPHGKHMRRTDVCENSKSALPRATIEGSTAAKRLRQIAYYVASLLLMTSTNSLVYITIKGQTFLPQSIFAVVFVFVIVVWFRTGIEIPWIRRWCIWLSFLGIAFVLISFISQSWGEIGIWLFFGLLILMPLALHQIRNANELDLCARSFCNCVCLFAGISIVLWLLGPISSVLSTNCTIANHWNAIPGSVKPAPGYFHLLYQMQQQSIGSFTIWRNTGIFPESPMYAYVLCVSLCIELFLLEKSRRLALVLLTSTILTTFSTTGIVLSLAMFVIKFAATFKPWHNLKKSIAFLISISAIGVVAGVSLVLQKLVSNSGKTHLDDFVACFRTWLESPLYGKGFNQYAAIQGYMSDFRLSNPGVSNSLGFVLATGGLVYFAIFGAGFFGFFFHTHWKLRVSGCFFFVLWAVTLVSNLPLSALIVSIGIEHLLSTSMPSRAS